MFILKENVLHKLKGFLTSFRGGGLKPNQAEKHGANLSYIFTHVGGKIDLCEDQVATLIEKKVNSAEWLPNTAKAYINSLKLFLRYAQTMVEAGKLPYDVKKLQAFEKSANLWCKSLFKLEQKRPKQPEPIVTPDDIQAYLCSKRAKHASELLAGRYSNTNASHTIVRNNLIMRVALSNCHRTGCLTNMTVQEFKAAIIKNDHFIIKVAEHKTAGTYGPAEVVLDKDLYRDVVTYIEVFRLVSSCPTIFLTYNGTKMESGTVAAALTTELGHAGVGKQYVSFYCLVH